MCEMCEEITDLKEDIEPAPTPAPEFIIPNIYRYSNDTKEYIGFAQADNDPEESRLQNRFVPLVPANATLLEVPNVEENQIQVYSKSIETKEEQWNIYADYRKNFLKVDFDFNVFDITTIGEQEGYIIVSKEIGEDIRAHKDWYKIVDNNIVKKADKEIKKQDLSNAKKNKYQEALQKAYSFEQEGTVEYKNCVFEMADSNRKNLSDTEEALKLKGEDSTTWNDKKDNLVTLTVEDIQFIRLNLILAKIQKLWIEQFPTYKAQIIEATTVEEVEAIVIDYSDKK